MQEKRALSGVFQTGHLLDGLHGDMSGSFFANNYPCLMAGVAMGRTLTFAMKAIKQG